MSKIILLGERVSKNEFAKHPLTNDFVLDDRFWQKLHLLIWHITDVALELSRPCTNVDSA